MADRDSTGAPVAPTVEARLYRYPGCAGWVKRWFIVGDRVPMPFFTRQEAEESLRSRPRPPGASTRRAAP